MTDSPRDAWHDGKRLFGAVSERVWRARKNHTWIDAQLRPLGDSGFELQFFYDGTVVSSRVWPSRAAAIAHAEQQLRELQRAGWNTHW